MTYYARFEPSGPGFAVVAGRDDGLTRIVLAAGELGPGEGGPLHLHHGEEILRILSGEVEVVVAGERRVCAAGDVVIIPTDTPHGFTALTQTTMEVIADLDAGQLFPVRDEDGTIRLAEVYRRDMPWGRRPPAGFDWTSDDELVEIVNRVPGRAAFSVPTEPRPRR